MPFSVIVLRAVVTIIGTTAIIRVVTGIIAITDTIFNNVSIDLAISYSSSPFQSGSLCCCSHQFVEFNLFGG
jgi:hypothetical protein